MNFLAERIRISIHEDENSVISFFGILFQIMTASTVTAFTGLIDSETITVEFEAFCFFTITVDFFGLGIGLWNAQRLRMALTMGWSFDEMTLCLGVGFRVGLKFLWILLLGEFLGLGVFLI